MLATIKIGEAARPSTYKKPVRLPDPTTHDEAWVQKSSPWMMKSNPWVTEDTVDGLANDTASAWLKHPANKLQLPSLQKAHDLDGDGVTNEEEFKSMLKAAGANVDSTVLFAAMDVDGDGVLTDAEIKALGQDRDGRAARTRQA